MLEWLGEPEEAIRIENAVCTVLEEGTIRTPDIGGNSNTEDVGDAIASNVALKQLS
jgi:isocitrate/isopropylmalate dehydrogenase